jgi:hypothetical protein
VADFLLKNPPPEEDVVVDELVVKGKVMFLPKLALFVRISDSLCGDVTPGPPPPT